MLLDAAVEHNKKTLTRIRNAIYSAAKQLRERCNKNFGFNNIITGVFNNFYLNPEKSVVGFCCLYEFECDRILTNIVRIDMRSRDISIQKRLDEVNRLHSEIVNIKDRIIKE